MLSAGRLLLPMIMHKKKYRIEFINGWRSCSFFFKWKYCCTQDANVNDWKVLVVACMPYAHCTQLCVHVRVCVCGHNACAVNTRTAFGWRRLKHTLSHNTNSAKQFADDKSIRCYICLVLISIGCFNNILCILPLAKMYTNTSNYCSSLLFAAIFAHARFACLLACSLTTLNMTF